MNASLPLRNGPRGWFASFYWRVGISYVLLVLCLLAVQGMMVGFVVARANAQLQGRLPGAPLASAAAALGAALEADSGLSLERALAGVALPIAGSLHAVMADGRVAGTGDALPDDVRRSALALVTGRLDGDGAAEPRGPIVGAPILVRGQLTGLLVIVPRRFPSPLREIARVMSLPGTLLLPGFAAMATLVIFGPARRRLAALERAAAQLGTGDLSARAPAVGRDEIARVAAAFNHMAGELAARDAAIRAETERRGQLLADASHELKTPLTTIRGALETLQMPAAAVERAARDRAVGMIDRESRRMSRIVADLLALAWHEHAAGAVEAQVFAPERLFAHVVERHRARAEAAGVTIAIVVEDGADQMTGDPHLLEQAVDNLVVNALRHTPAGGGIELRASPAGDATCLVVIDSGPGIPAHHAARIFERFYKTEAARPTGNSGSGLGLSIVKAIAERHGGAAGVESVPGRTAFTIRVPQAVPQDGRGRAEGGPRGPAAREERSE